MVFEDICRESYFTRIGPSCIYRPFAYRQCSHNLIRGVEYRIAREMPLGNESTLDLFHRYCIRMIPIIFPNNVVTAWSDDDYIDSRPKNSTKFRLKMAKANPLVTFRKPSNQMFVKNELRMDVKEPRVICDVNPRWTLKFGPWCAAIAESVKKNCSYFAAYYKPNRLSNWMRGRHEKVKFYDFSTFDLSLTKTFFLIECRFYRHFGMPRELVSMLYKGNTDWSVRTKHRDDIQLAFKVEDRCRQSGDPHTSLSNNVLAILAHLFAHTLSYSRYKGYPDHSILSLENEWVHNLTWFDMLNNGDDAAIVSELAPVDLTIYTELGLKIKETNDYCKMTVLRCANGDVVMARSPKDYLGRFGYSKHVLNTGTERIAALHGNCICNSYIVSGVPIYWKLVQSCFALCQSVPPCYDSVNLHYLILLRDSMEKSKLKFQPIVEPDEVTRQHFAHAFGVEVKAQYEIEHMIQYHMTLDTILSHPALDALFDGLPPEHSVAYVDNAT